MQITTTVKKSKPGAEPHSSRQGCTVGHRKGAGQSSMGGGGGGSRGEHETLVHVYIDKDHFLLLAVARHHAPKKNVQILFLSQNGVSHQLQS
jgi:hypothetical protein